MNERLPSNCVCGNVNNFLLNSLLYPEYTGLGNYYWRFGVILWHNLKIGKESVGY